MLKKMLIYMIIISMILMTSVALTASEILIEDEHATLCDLIMEQDSSLVAQLMDPDMFDSSLSNVDLQNNPLLLVYSIHYPAYADKKTFAENVEDFESRFVEDRLGYFVLLDDTPSRIFISQDKTSIGIADTYQAVPTFIQDIIDGAICQQFQGEAHTISHVYCFDASSSHKGTTVVFDTDGGRFVRFYEDESAEAVEFRWQDYEEKAIAFFAFTTSDEYNYDPVTGSPIYSGVSFLDFANDPSKYQASSNFSFSGLKGSSAHYLGFGILTVFIISAAVLFTKRLRKRH